MFGWRELKGEKKKGEWKMIRLYKFDPQETANVSQNSISFSIDLAMVNIYHSTIILLADIKTTGRY